MTNLNDIKYFLSNWLLQRGWIIKRLKTNEHLNLFINRFNENYKKCELTLVGGTRDGGYLLPTVLNEIEECFSPGVSTESFFEKELSDKYNIKSYMSDGSVDAPSLNDNNLEFSKAYIGSMRCGDYNTLSKCVEQNAKSDNLLLQMDI